MNQLTGNFADLPDYARQDFLWTVDGFASDIMNLTGHGRAVLKSFCLSVSPKILQKLFDQQLVICLNDKEDEYHFMHPSAHYAYLMSAVVGYVAEKVLERAKQGGTDKIMSVEQILGLE